MLDIVQLVQWVYHEMHGHMWAIRGDDKALLELYVHAKWIENGKMSFLYIWKWLSPC